MLRLEAYGARDRQHALQIMRQCRDEGLSLAECMKAVESAMPQGIEEVVPRQVKSVKQCPQCGSKNYHRGKDKFGGVTTEFMWCKSCTYSEEIK